LASALRGHLKQHCYITQLSSTLTGHLKQHSHTLLHNWLQHWQPNDRSSKTTPCYITSQAEWCHKSDESAAQRTKNWRILFVHL